MKLQDYLSAFSIEDLREVAARRSLPLSPALMSSRQTLVRTLAAALDRGDTVYGIVMQLNQAELAVLHAVLHSGKSAALSRLAADGADGALLKATLESLRLWGLLFPEGDWEHIVVPPSVRNATHYMPGRRAEPLAELIRTPPLVTAAGTCAVRPGSFSRDLAEFLARVARSRFKLTQAGRINRRDLKGMESAFALSEEGYSFFLYSSALGLRLLSRDSSGVLGITEGADILLGQAEPMRSALIVSAWLVMRGYPESAAGDPADYDYVPTSLSAQRGLMLATLAGLPEGEAATVASISARLVWSTPLAFQQWDSGRDAQRTVMRLARSLSWLGLACVDDPSSPKAVVISPLGSRAFDLKRTEPALVPEEPHFFLQPNAEIFAPPNLSPRTLLHVRRITGEKKGAAEGIFPVSADSLRRAFDTGLVPAEVVTFLERFSRTGLPNNVRALVETAGRQHGRIRLVPAGYVLVTDEPQLLEELRRLKPVEPHLGEGITDRVTRVDETQVAALMRALRQRGYAPMNEAEAGLSTPLPDDPETTPELLLPDGDLSLPTMLSAGSDLDPLSLEALEAAAPVFEDEEMLPELPEALLKPIRGPQQIRDVLKLAQGDGWVAEITYANRLGDPPKPLTLEVFEVDARTVYAFCFETESERTFDLRAIQTARLTGEVVVVDRLQDDDI